MVVSSSGSLVLFYFFSFVIGIILTPPTFVFVSYHSLLCLRLVSFFFCTFHSLFSLLAWVARLQSPPIQHPSTHPFSPSIFYFQNGFIFIFICISSLSFSLFLRRKCSFSWEGELCSCRLFQFDVVLCIWRSDGKVLAIGVHQALMYVYSTFVRLRQAGGYAHSSRTSDRVVSSCCECVGALVRAHMSPSGISSKPSPIHIDIIIIQHPSYIGERQIEQMGSSRNFESKTTATMAAPWVGLSNNIGIYTVEC